MEDKRLSIYGIGPVYGGIVAGLTAAAWFCGRLPALAVR